MQSLTQPELDLLRDIVELHEQHGTLTVHENMPDAERELVSNLVLKGMVELRKLTKEHPIEQRPVVPTPVGRERVAEWLAEAHEQVDYAAMMAEEGVTC